MEDDIRDSIARLERAFTSGDRLRRGAVSNAVFRRIITHNGGSSKQAEALMTQFADTVMPHAVNYVHLLAHMRTLASATQSETHTVPLEPRRSHAKRRTIDSDTYSLSHNASNMSRTSNTTIHGRHCTLRRIFRCIDTQHTGHVTVREMYEALHMRGVPITLWELAAVAETLNLTESNNNNNNNVAAASRASNSDEEYNDKSSSSGSDEEDRVLDVADFCLLVSRLRPQVIEHIRRASLWQGALALRSKDRDDKSDMDAVGQTTTAMPSQTPSVIHAEAELSFSPPPAVHVAHSEASSNVSERRNVVGHKSQVRPLLTATSRGSEAQVTRNGRQGRGITSQGTLTRNGSNTIPSQRRSRVSQTQKVSQADFTPPPVAPRHTKDSHVSNEIEEEVTLRHTGSRTHAVPRSHRSPVHTQEDDNTNSTSISPLTQSPSPETNSPAPLSQRIRAKLKGLTSQLLTTCMHLDPQHTGLLPTTDFVAALRRVCPALSSAEVEQLTRWALREANRVSTGATTVTTTLCAYVQLARDLIVAESHARRRSLSQSLTPSPSPALSSASSQPDKSSPKEKEGERNSCVGEDDDVRRLLPATRSARARMCRLMRQELYSAVRNTSIDRDSNRNSSRREEDAVRAFLVQFDDTRTGYMDRTSLTDSLSKLFLRGRGQAIRPWLLRRCMALARLPFVREEAIAHTYGSNAVNDVPAAMTRAEAAARRRLHRIPRPLWRVLYDYRFLLEELEEQS